MKATLLLALALPCALPAQQPAETAATIMARVAAHQDTAEADRDHYVYIQHTRVTSHKGKTVMCEETTDSRVTPIGKKSHQQLLKLDGRYLLKGQYVTYTKPNKKYDNDDPDNTQVSISTGNDDSDRNLVEDMRHSFTNGDSKDGIAANLFPLTTKQLATEDFKLIGRERTMNRDTFHLAFTPKDKSEYGWKGDAYIDTTDFQPVLVHTSLSRNLPFAVRALLGTNVPGLGFTITYAPQPGGVWFPTSFGTEFKIKILFFYSRQVTVFAENRDFEKTHVTSHIVGDVTPSEPQPEKPPQS